MRINLKDIIPEEAVPFDHAAEKAGMKVGVSTGAEACTRTRLARFERLRDAARAKTPDPVLHLRKNG